MCRNGFRVLFGLMFVLLLCCGAVAAEIKGARMMPEGKVIVSKGGKTIGVYSKEMPVPEGALLTCKGKCGVRLDDMLLVAEDKSRFSIDTRNNQRVLNVQEGTVYFGLTTLPRTVVFKTPDGAFAADHVVLHASASSRMLEGYVKGADGISEMGVLSGGLLPLKTSRGVKTLKPGKRIFFRQVEMEAEEEAEREGAGAIIEGGGGAGSGAATGTGLGLAAGGTVSTIVATGTFVGGSIFTAIHNNQGDDADASPSTP